MAKYYGGVTGKRRGEVQEVVVFTSRARPTKESHGRLYKFVYGPFETKAKLGEWFKKRPSLLVSLKKKNPEIPEEVLEFREKVPKGKIMKPSTFKAIEKKAKRGKYKKPRAVAGAAYWKTVKAKYRQALHDYVVKEILRGDRPYQRIADDLVRITKGGLTWGQANKFVKEVWNEMGGMKKNFDPSLFTTITAGITAGTLASKKLGKYMKNPPRGAVEIYDDILAIEAQKGKSSLWPNENFRHDFKARKGKASIFGLPDGSLLVKGKKRLWKKFKYGKGDV